jgi:hypothetical protein
MTIFRPSNETDGIISPLTEPDPTRLLLDAYDEETWKIAGFFLSEQVSIPLRAL